MRGIRSQLLVGECFFRDGATGAPLPAHTFPTCFRKTELGGLMVTGCGCVSRRSAASAHVKCWAGI